MNKRAGKHLPDLATVAESDRIAVALHSYCFGCGINLKRHMRPGNRGAVSIWSTKDGKWGASCRDCAQPRPEEYEYKGRLELPTQQ